MSQDSRTRRYSNIKILIKIAEILLLFLYLVILQFSNLSGTLKTIAYSISNNNYAAVTVYFLIFSGIYYVITFPLTYYSGYSLEHKYSLSNQRISAWLKDEFKGSLLNLVISLAFIHLLYIFLRRFHANWWAWMAMVWILFTVVLSEILPTVVIPLFYKSTIVKNNELRQRLKELSERARIKVLDIYELDFSRKTKKANAALVGLGKTRRIILADNLISDFTPEEVEVVVGHEIGHHRLRHMLQLLFFGGGISLLGFYVASAILANSLDILGVEAIYDIEIFPFLCCILLVFSLLMLPLQNGFSRRIEVAADAFTLRLTRNKDGFISTMNKLAEKNLADKRPNKFIELIFYNHPSISKRIEFAKRFKP